LSVEDQKGSVWAMMTMVQSIQSMLRCTMPLPLLLLVDEQEKKTV
jgi:hypothetical protein